MYESPLARLEVEIPCGNSNDMVVVVVVVVVERSEGTEADNFEGANFERISQPYPTPARKYCERSWRKLYKSM